MLVNQEDSSTNVDVGRNENDPMDCGYTKLDRLRNVVVREKVKIAPLEEKMRKTRLRPSLVRKLELNGIKT